MEAQENKFKTDIIYGIHAVTEAMQNNTEINKILVQKETKNAGIANIIKLCGELHIPYQFVPKEKFYALKQKNHQGVCAYVSPIVYQNLDTLTTQWFSDGIEPMILVLDKVTDMRNFGAIARTALCSGVNAIVVPHTDSAPVNMDAIKTSAGALLKIPVCREKHLKTTIEYLNQCGFTTIACTEKADYTLSQTDFSGPIAIILGSEEKGISPDVLNRCRHKARIPMNFGVASLNVSVAAGIAMYEAICQRNL
ncbi:MAG: 23S rRNA (guanosine(2251)-2'-O)-methyltransferase RlmB [Bacteroidia bacterium]